MENDHGMAGMPMEDGRKVLADDIVFIQNTLEQSFQRFRRKQDIEGKKGIHIGGHLDLMGNVILPETEISS